MDHAFDELASNAARFGSLSTETGRLRIGWQIVGTELRLEWLETGGPAIGEKRETGFGSRLILRSLDKILGSTVRLEFPPTGVQARIAFPLG